jgi:hypothetical protein
MMEAEEEEDSMEAEAGEEDLAAAETPAMEEDRGVAMAPTASRPTTRFTFPACQGI